MTTVRDNMTAIPEESSFICTLFSANQNSRFQKEAADYPSLNSIMSTGGRSCTDKRLLLRQPGLLLPSRLHIPGIYAGEIPPFCDGLWGLNHILISFRLGSIFSGPPWTRTRSAVRRRSYGPPSCQFLSPTHFCIRKTACCGKFHNKRCFIRY